MPISGLRLVEWPLRLSRPGLLWRKVSNELLKNKHNAGHRQRKMLELH
jgi:hypothetical protein